MEKEYNEEQEKNRKKALEHMSEWLDYFFKADHQYKNLLGTDYVKLLTVKAQGNRELNDKLNQVIKSIDMLAKIFD